MKGDMNVEVLTEPKDDKAAGRMKKIWMTPEEQKLYYYSPNAARDNLHPGCPTDDYGEV